MKFNCYATNTIFSVMLLCEIELFCCMYGLDFGLLGGYFDV